MFSFAMLVTKNFHLFHSISYRFRYKHLLHKNKFLHLQHNLDRQFKGELVHFVLNKKCKKHFKNVQIIANALNALIVFPSNVFIAVPFLSHKQFNYVDL